ncbi:MAG: hypothetical protein K2G90_01120 [Muribaculaceae bacterium]|nr:hypothetical protein [Muribaculaceae bacterium]
MKKKVFRLPLIMMVAVVGLLSTGCAPMVYDSNPHFSHHRVPPKPMPKPLPPSRPNYGIPAPGQPGNNIKPAPAPGQPNPNTPGRPGNNNHR